MITKYKNFQIGTKVKTLVILTDENDNVIPEGTILRIVAIASKVRVIKKYGVEDRYHDNSAYFYNAVMDGQQNEYSNRIRANFCTVSRIAS